MAVWYPRQIATQNIDSERGSHEDRAYPEAPVTMHPSPVRPGIRFTSAVAIPFGVVLVSSHFVSISWEYSPRAHPSNKIQMHKALLPALLSLICQQLFERVDCFLRRCKLGLSLIPRHLRQRCLRSRLFPCPRSRL